MKSEEKRLADDVKMMMQQEGRKGVMSVSCREVDMLLIRCTSHFFFWGYLSLLLSLSGKIVALITSMGKSSLRV